MVWSKICSNILCINPIPLGKNTICHHVNMSYDKVREEQDEALNYIENFKALFGLCYRKTANVQNFGLKGCWIWGSQFLAETEANLFLFKDLVFTTSSPQFSHFPQALNSQFLVLQ